MMSPMRKRGLENGDNNADSDNDGAKRASVMDPAKEKAMQVAQSLMMKNPLSMQNFNQVPSLMDEMPEFTPPPQQQQQQPQHGHHQDYSNQRGNAGPPQQQQQQDSGPQVEEEVPIPNKLVGLVIGRGGEMINKLQADTGAQIQVASDPPPDMQHEDRIISLSGSTESVAKAREILDHIREHGKVPSHIYSTIPQGEYSQDYMIPKTKVGLVIGKGGEMIRSLQERAGCKMVLIQDGIDPEATQKPLRITGDPQKCEYAKQLVGDLLAGNLPPNPPPSGGNHGNGGFQPGPPQWNNGPQGPWGGPPQQNGPPGGGGQRDGPPLQPGHVVMEIKVPASKTGLCIGKGGETLKHIRTTTNINIEMNKTVPDDAPFRVFTMQGTEEQITQATDIIRQKCKDDSLTPFHVGGGPAAPQQPDPWGMQQQGGGYPPHQQPNPWGQPQPPMGWGQLQWPGYQQQPGPWQQQPGGPPAWPQQQPGAPAAPSTDSATITGAPTAAGQPVTSSASAQPAAAAADGQPDYSAQWAAYYAQMGQQQQYAQHQQYGQQPQQQWGGAPQQAPAAAAPAAPAAAAPATNAAGQPDYSAQWAAYYAQYYPGYNPATGAPPPS